MHVALLIALTHLAVSLSSKPNNALRSIRTTDKCVRGHDSVLAAGPRPDAMISLRSVSIEPGAGAVAGAVADDDDAAPLDAFADTRAMGATTESTIGSNSRWAGRAKSTEEYHRTEARSQLLQARVLDSAVRLQLLVSLC